MVTSKQRFTLERRLAEVCLHPARTEGCTCCEAITEIEQLRTALHGNRLWLKAALVCKAFDWDVEQRAAAEGCVEEAFRLIGPGPAPAPESRDG